VPKGVKTTDVRTLTINDGELIGENEGMDFSLWSCASRMV
jgi:hypothetical protein